MTTLIPAQDLSTVANPHQFETNGEVEKVYEFGRKGRAPYAIVTTYTNGTAEVENCQTGVVHIANRAGVNEAFGLAKRISETRKARDFAAGW